MMRKISRNIEDLARSEYDAIVIGGGIYGVMTALQAGMVKKRVLLLEKEDFGSQTSHYHLRTLHGGFRYLQSADIKRFYESVGERKWYMKHFPDMVEVLPCLLPLYGKIPYHPLIMRAGIMANDLLSHHRNKGLSKDICLPKGYILSKTATQEAFPRVKTDGLKGGAVWYDAAMPENQRLFMAVLNWACHLGATVVNYVQATDIMKQDGLVKGVRAYDKESGNSFEFKAPVVINAAGPWCREMAEIFDRDYPELFRKKLLLWNILFDREALSSHALALAPRKNSGHTYFLHNWKNRMLIGTGEEIIENIEADIVPTGDMIAQFITDINTAVPGLGLDRDEILHIYSGALPANAKGKLANREIIIDHSRRSGPVGLFSISGIKYTTARLVAEKLIQRIFPDDCRASTWKVAPPKGINSRLGFFDYDWQPGRDDSSWLNDLRQIISEESVLHLVDLLFNRTSLAENPSRIAPVLSRLRETLSLTGMDWKEEIERINRRLARTPFGKTITVE